MQRKLLGAILGASTLLASANVQAEAPISIGLNYGAFSGANLDLSYPINDNLQVRGSLSGGMDLSESTSDTDIEYEVETNGGIHRLALDYHPFANGFFLSAGYAINNFSLDGTGSALSGQTVTIGDTSYNVDADVQLDASLEWDSAPTLSLGWGHSPAKGFGFLFEVGAYFTGAPDVSLAGTGTVDGLDVSTEIADDIAAEEKKLKEDVGDYDFLPMLQAGVTYRF